MKQVNDHRLRNVLLTAVAAALIVGPLSYVSLPAAEEGDEPPLHKYMEQVNEGYKLLRRSARKATYGEEELKAVGSMITNAAMAMHETPPMAEKVTDADAKKKMVIGYKKVMAKLITDLMNLEIAMLEGKAEDAGKLIENLAVIKKEGHDNYVEE